MASTSMARTPGLHDAVTRFRTVLRDNGLSLVAAGLFLVSVVGMALSGMRAYNQELAEHGRAALGLGAYLTSGHYLEALFENWESEFLQMGLFVLLTAWLFQRGSAESKSLDEPEPVDADPKRARRRRDAPGPVRQGGFLLSLYRHSLSIALLSLFVGSFALHAVTGTQRMNAENARHGNEPLSVIEYVGTSQFWYESFQNWQSEFLAVLAIVVLSIFLREQGSAQSKPVAAPHSETGR